MEPIRVGIIGFGMMGRMQAVGCFGALGEEFRLAAVVTPDFLHEEMAIACLKSGRHLRLEKPMALDPGGCARVIEAAERAGTVTPSSPSPAASPTGSSRGGIRAAPSWRSAATTSTS